MIPLRESTLDVEGLLHLSKHIDQSLLIDADEMISLLVALQPCYLLSANGIVKKGSELIKKDTFLNYYQSYITALKNGAEPTINRTLFYSSLTVDPHIFYAIPLKGDKQLIKATQPVIQLKPHTLSLALYDQTIRSVTENKNGILWGLTLSYPQIFQNSKTKECVSTNNNPDLVNSKLFNLLRKWIRTYTVATPLEINGKRINIPARLGKSCFSWINEHPQLKAKGLSVIQVQKNDND